MIREKIRILYFIESLNRGGKERRLIELLSYLKTKDDYELFLVLKDDSIMYDHFYSLNINYISISDRKRINFGRQFLNYWKAISEFKPDIVHAWGRMPAFLSLPYCILNSIPLVNSQIASSPPNISRFSFLNLLDRINFCLSNVILSNSFAGLLAYKPPAKKSLVIYNGVNLERFVNPLNKESLKVKFGIKTEYVVVMVASYSKNKDYDLFVEVAKNTISKRNDISFIGIGGGNDVREINRIKNLANDNENIFLPGSSDQVEDLINLSNVAVLFSNNSIHGEGISNSILEYMSFEKPVIANKSGGTSEIVQSGINGYLIENETIDEISELIIHLIDDESIAKYFGETNRMIVESKFTLDLMGKNFEKEYINLISPSMKGSL